MPEFGNAHSITRAAIIVSLLGVTGCSNAVVQNVSTVRTATTSTISVFNQAFLSIETLNRELTYSEEVYAFLFPREGTCRAGTNDGTSVRDHEEKMARDRRRALVLLKEYSALLDRLATEDSPGETAATQLAAIMTSIASLEVGGVALPANEINAVAGLVRAVVKLERDVRITRLLLQISPRMKRKINAVAKDLRDAILPMNAQAAALFKGLQECDLARLQKLRDRDVSRSEQFAIAEGLLTIKRREAELRSNLPDVSALRKALDGLVEAYTNLDHFSVDQFVASTKTFVDEVNALDKAFGLVTTTFR